MKETVENINKEIKLPLESYDFKPLVARSIIILMIIFSILHLLNIFGSAEFFKNMLTSLSFIFLGMVTAKYFPIWNKKPIKSDLVEIIEGSD